jgi:uncharacterized membrane protein YgcG
MCLRIAGFLGLLLSAIVPACAQPYPRPAGPVNDFAHVLSPIAAESLSRELAAFQGKTTIEIAVVTVNSLEGKRIEDYTRALATEWGVGKRGRNNGVVLLVAPNERKMRIETASGIRSLLTDARADAIRDGAILPRFRVGDMPGGIIDGTHAIMRFLDETSPPPRGEESKSIGRTWQDTRVFLFVIGGIAGIVALLFMIAPPIRRASARHFVFEDQGAFAQQLMRAETIAAQPNVTKKTRRELALLRSDFIGSAIPSVTAMVDNTDWIEARKQLKSFYRRLHRINSAIRNSIALAEAARSSGPKLMQELPGLLEEAKNKLAKGKKSKKAAKHLEEARAKYKQARRQYSDTTDWVVTYGLLYDSRECCMRAQTVHQQLNGVKSPAFSDGGGTGVETAGGVSHGGGFDGGGSSGGW